jgi:type II secretory pathway pseudopilin PulG
MKRGQMPHGYTIIEVMIFLAITGALLVSALAIFNGQQSRTRFTQSLREIDAQIRAVATEVEAGYYPNNGRFRCVLSGNAPQLIVGGVDQGSNRQCTFLGKSLQFGVNQPGCNDTTRSDCTRYAMHTIIGRRVEGNGQEVQTLEDPDGSSGVFLTGAQPRLAVHDSDSRLNLADVRTVPGSLTVYNMYEVRGGTITEIGSVGFIYSLTSYGGTNDPISGAQTVDVVTIPGSRLGQNSAAEAADVQTLSEANRHPDQIVICFGESASSGRKGAIIIGGQGRRLATEVVNNITPGAVPGNRC